MQQQEENTRFLRIVHWHSKLFEATGRRFYFRNVSILVPITWKSKTEYLTPKQESYDQADVIVADPHLKYGDDPYTLQYGQCGDRGQYIHFTPNFLLIDNLIIYGPRGTNSYFILLISTGEKQTTNINVDF